MNNQLSRRIFVMFLLAAIYSAFASNMACAREIVIGKYKYPALILIPIVSIAICSIILLVLLLNIARKRIGSVKIGKVFFSLKKPRREKRHENIYLKDIKKFKKELAGMQTEQAFNMLSDITKNFFKELLDLHYEFTYDELEKELRKRNKRKELIDICHELSELKYSGKRITKQELDVFAQKIQELIKKEEVRKEITELEVSKALRKEKPSLFGMVARLESEKEKKKHLLELMKQEEEALKKDMEIAKNIYHRILSSYYKLPSKDRKEIYERLTNFYQEVNRMLFSSFYSKQSKKQLEYFTKKLEALHKEAEKVIAKEKAIQVWERGKAVKLKVPELPAKPQVEIPRKIEIAKEKAIKAEELKKLEKIEKEARERIKNIAESVVEQTIMQKPVEKPEEKTIIREIKYVMPAEKPLVKAIVHAAEYKAEHRIKRLKPEIHAKPVHVAKIHKPEEIQAREKAEVSKVKSKKFMHIAKEEREIRERLEKLRKGYIG